MPTGKQIRAARVLAGWDIKDLAPRAGLSVTAVQNIETGAIPKPATADRIIKAFSDVGVEFTDNEGVRRRPQGVEIFEGAERFEDFYDFLYNYLEAKGGDVCLSVENENLFKKHRSAAAFEKHRTIFYRLVNEGTVRFKILTRHSQYWHKNSYPEYRWLPSEEKGSPVAFYAFGDCLALISFDGTTAPYVVLHKSGPFAQAYHASFDAMWKISKQPPEDS